MEPIRVGAACRAACQGQVRRTPPLVASLLGAARPANYTKAESFACLVPEQEQALVGSVGLGEEH
jgi:hypothetical protein